MPVVDPKYLRKQSKEIMRSFQCPKYIHEYLRAKGINVTAVCVDAMKRELAKGTKTNPEKGHYTFKVPEDLALAFKDAGHSLSEVCTRALEAVYAELKAEAKERGK